jgi:hypothetical protein
MWGSWDAFETHDVSHLRPSALSLTAAGPSFALIPGSVAKQELIAAQSQPLPPRLKRPLLLTGMRLASKRPGVVSTQESWSTSHRTRCTPTSAIGATSCPRQSPGAAPPIHLSLGELCGRNSAVAAPLLIGLVVKSHLFRRGSGTYTNHA